MSEDLTIVPAHAGYEREPYTLAGATKQELKHLVWEEWADRVNTWVDAQNLDHWITISEPIHDLMHVAIGYTHFEECVASTVDAALRTRNLNLYEFLQYSVRSAADCSGDFMQVVTDEQARRYYNRLLQVETIQMNGAICYERGGHLEKEAAKETKTC